MDEFDSSGTFLRTFPGTGGGNSFQSTGLTVDPTSGDVIMGDGREYDASGNFLGNVEPAQSGASPTGAPAFNAAGYLYMPGRVSYGYREDVVDIYKPSTSVPSLRTTESRTRRRRRARWRLRSARPERKTSPPATLNMAPISPMQMEPYPALPIQGRAVSAPTGVSANLSGLATETTYHYRVVVESEGAKSYGADQTYTPHGVIGLTTEEAGAD